MRFAILSALLLGASTTLAHPADKRDSCCCCDISRPAIMCRVKADCVCAMVMCPPGAPTVWIDSIYTGTDIGIIEPTETATQTEVEDSTETDGSEDDSFECCCCDASQGAIVCENKDNAADCICPAVACPTSAPTIYAPQTTATPTATSTPDPEPCCCCNPAEGEVVCSMPDSSDDDQGCFCLAVMCPSGAPTRWVSASEPTSTS